MGRGRFGQKSARSGGTQTTRRAPPQPQPQPQPQPRPKPSPISVTVKKPISIKPRPKKPVFKSKPRPTKPPRNNTQPVTTISKSQTISQPQQRTKIRLTQANQQQPPKQLTKQKFRPLVEKSENQSRLEQAQELNRQQIAREQSFGGTSVVELDRHSTHSKQRQVESARIEANRRENEAFNKFDFGTNITNPPRSSDTHPSFGFGHKKTQRINQARDTFLMGTKGRIEPPTLEIDKVQVSVSSADKFKTIKLSTKKINKGQIISTVAREKPQPQGFGGFNFGQEVSSFVQHFPQTKVGKGISKTGQGLQQAGEGIFDLAQELPHVKGANIIGNAFVTVGTDIGNTKPAQDVFNFFGEGIEKQKGNISKVIDEPTPQNVGNVLVGEPVTDFLGNFFGEQQVKKPITRASSTTKKPVAKKTASIPEVLRQQAERLKKKNKRDRR